MPRLLAQCCRCPNFMSPLSGDYTCRRCRGETRRRKSGRIQVRKLPRHETAAEGAYWAEVDGQKVGDNGRAFWRTAAEARRCGMKFLNLCANQMSTEQ